jgi:hypothetical protein
MLKRRDHSPLNPTEPSALTPPHGDPLAAQLPGHPAAPASMPAGNGGAAPSEGLTDRQRRELAMRAAAARWKARS